MENVGTLSKDGWNLWSLKVRLSCSSVLLFKKKKKKAKIKREGLIGHLEQTAIDTRDLILF